MSRVEDRWPVEVGQWVALPVALLRHAAELGLSDGELRLIATLEALRRGDEPSADISQAELSRLVGCDERSVRRRAERLAERGYLHLDRGAVRGDGRTVSYQLDGLWAALAGYRTPASGNEPNYRTPASGNEPNYRTPASGNEPNYRTPASARSRDSSFRSTDRGGSPPKKSAGKRLTFAGDLSRFDRLDGGGT